MRLARERMAPLSKLRAIGQWIWVNKERMFLLVMLVILVWRVYKVMNPEKAEEPTIPAPASSVGPSFPTDHKPGEPKGAPDLPPPADLSSLWIRNPFTVYSDTAQQGGRGSDAKQDDIELLDIQKSGTAAPSVKLRYGNTQKWHKEGDSFVSYKLLSIDVENKSCEVYSENKGRSITLKVKK